MQCSVSLKVTAFVSVLTETPVLHVYCNVSDIAVYRSITAHSHRSLNKGLMLAQQTVLHACVFVSKYEKYF